MPVNERDQNWSRSSYLIYQTWKDLVAKMSFQILFSVKAINFIKYKIIPTGLCSPWEVRACPGLGAERGIEGFSCPFFFEDWIEPELCQYQSKRYQPWRGADGGDQVIWSARGDKMLQAPKSLGEEALVISDLESYIWLFIRLKRSWFHLYILVYFYIIFVH